MMNMIALLKQNRDTITSYEDTILISICVFFAVMIAIANLPWKTKELHQTRLEIELIVSFISRTIRSYSSSLQKTLGNLKRCLKPRRT